MQEGFLTDVKTAAIFFRFCARYKIKSRAERILVVREIVRRKKAAYIRDVEKFTEGKKVLKVNFRPGHNSGPEHRCPHCTPKEKYL